MTKISDKIAAGLEQLTTDRVTAGLGHINHAQAAGLARMTNLVASGLERISSDVVAQGLAKLHTDVGIMAAIQALGVGLSSAVRVDNITVNPILREYFGEGGDGDVRVEEIVDARLAHNASNTRYAEKNVEEKVVRLEEKVQMLLDTVKELKSRLESKK